MRNEFERLAWFFNQGTIIRTKLNEIELIKNKKLRRSQAKLLLGQQLNLYELICYSVKRGWIKKKTFNDLYRKSVKYGWDNYSKNAKELDIENAIDNMEFIEEVLKKC